MLKNERKDWRQTVNRPRSHNPATVSGRELHEALEVKSKYADWFKNMCAYGFTDGEDYTSFSKILENGGRTIEHALTIPMAKELCLLQRNEIQLFAEKIACSGEPEKT